MRAILLSILIATALMGCVSTAPSSIGIAEVSPNDANAVALATTAKPNANQGHIEYSGPIIFHENNVLNRHYHVRGWRNITTKKFEGAQIYLGLPSNEWVFYNSAFSNGKHLKMTEIDREVGSCGGGSCRVTETIGIDLTLDQLRGYAKTGFSGEIQGKRGSTIVYIPASYFQGYLTKFD